MVSHRVCRQDFRLSFRREGRKQRPILPLHLYLLPPPPSWQPKRCKERIIQMQGGQKRTQKQGQALQMRLPFPVHFLLDLLPFLEHNRGYPQEEPSIMGSHLQHLCPLKKKTKKARQNWQSCSTLMQHPKLKREIRLRLVSLRIPYFCFNFLRWCHVSNRGFWLKG